MIQTTKAPEGKIALVTGRSRGSGAAAQRAARAVAAAGANVVISEGIMVNAVRSGPMDTDMNPANGPYGD